MIEDRTDHAGRQVGSTDARAFRLAHILRKSDDRSGEACSDLSDQKTPPNTSQASEMNEWILHGMIND